MNCSPQFLVNAARCFKSCGSVSSIQAIKSYILCAMYNNGGVGGANLIPAGSSYSGGGSYTLNVLANTSYNITWGANDTSVNICGTVYNSGGAGSLTTVYTGSCTTMVFTGTGGSTVTAVVQKNSAKLPIPSGFTFTINTNGTQVTAAWDNQNLTFVNYTEVWTSTDGVTYALAATVNVPTASATLTAPTSGNFLYAKVRWCSTALASCGSFSGAIKLSGRVANWAARVITNGGAAVSASTIAAMNTFDLGLVSNSLDSLMNVVNCFVPDSLVAIRTPLYVGGGNDPWAWGGVPYVAGDVSINGLTGDGTGKYLDTGFNPSVGFASANSGGGSTYVYSFVSATGGCDWGNLNAGGTAGFNSTMNQAATNKYFLAIADNSGANDINGVAGQGNGFYSGNRTAINSLVAYFATSTTPWASFASNVNNNTQVHVNATTYFDALRLSTGLPTSYTKNTHSFHAFHSGLNSAQGQTLFNLVQAMRVSFGGGYR